MTYDQYARVAVTRLEELRRESWAIAQARKAGRRSYLTRSLADLLRRLAETLDGEASARYAPAR